MALHGSLLGSASVWAEARLPLALLRGRHICGLEAPGRLQSSARRSLRLLSSDVIYGIARSPSIVLESMTGGSKFLLRLCWLVSYARHLRCNLRVPISLMCRFKGPPMQILSHLSS